MRLAISRGRIRRINLLQPTYNVKKNIRSMLSMAQPEDDDHHDDYVIEQSGAKKSWQAQDDIDIQRVTQQAIVSVSFVILVEENGYFDYFFSLIIVSSFPSFPSFPYISYFPSSKRHASDS